MGSQFPWKNGNYPSSMKALSSSSCLLLSQTLGAAHTGIGVVDSLFWGWFLTFGLSTHALFHECPLASSCCRHCWNSPEGQIGGLKDLRRTMGMSYENNFLPLLVRHRAFQLVHFFSVNGHDPDHVWVSGCWCLLLSAPYSKALE